MTAHQTEVIQLIIMGAGIIGIIWFIGWVFVEAFNAVKDWIDRKACQYIISKIEGRSHPLNRGLVSWWMPPDPNALFVNQIMAIDSTKHIKEKLAEEEPAQAPLKPTVDPGDGWRLLELLG